MGEAETLIRIALSSHMIVMENGARVQLKKGQILKAHLLAPDIAQVNPGQPNSFCLYRYTRAAKDASEFEVVSVVDQLGHLAT